MPGGTWMTRSLPLRPWQLAPLPCRPPSARHDPTVGQRGQAVDALLGHDDHAAAVAAVAAVGTALGDVTLAAEAAATVAAVAGRHLDLHAIDKHACPPPKKKGHFPQECP